MIREEVGPRGFSSWLGRMHLNTEDLGVTTELEYSPIGLRGSTEPLQSNAEPLQRHAEQLHGVATTSFASATCSVKQLQTLYEQLSLSNSRLKAQMYMAAELRG